MASPMMEWCLDTHYKHLFHANNYIEKSFIVGGAMEAIFTPLMEQIEAEFPLIRVFSLPSVGDPSKEGIRSKRHIELGVKGPVEIVDISLAKLRSGVEALGGITYDLA